MGTLHSAVVTTVLICIYVFVAAWLAGAVYFTLRNPQGFRADARSAAGWIGRRLLLGAGIAALWVLLPRGGGSWHWLRYWQPVLGVLGVLLAVAGTALLLWARWVLGAMWSGVPTVKRDHRLVTGGPYHFVRHPIYTGLLLLAGGAMLAFGFGVYAVLAVLAVPFVLRRVHREDQLMRRTFGAEYDAYRARVPALFPRRPTSWSTRRGSSGPSDL